MTRKAQPLISLKTGLLGAFISLPIISVFICLSIIYELTLMIVIWSVIFGMTFLSGIVILRKISLKESVSENDSKQESSPL